MENKKMNKEERLALAEKLDADLDAFIDSMAANKNNTTPKKPFDIDEWCENIGKHPAFMTNLEFDENGELPEAIQAIQALKYDDDDETDACELAKENKNEGNKHFQLKKYRWAVDCYTNGIKRCCTDRLLNSILYANRAAAQKHLGNKYSALKDCLVARKFDPTNLKAILRGSELLLEMNKFGECLKWIDNSLSEKIITELSPQKREKFDIEIEEIRKKAKFLRVKEERNERQKKKQTLSDVSQKRQLLNAFKERSLRFQPTISGYREKEVDENLFEWSDLEISFPQCEQRCRVRYNENSNQLIWPLLIQYPEVAQTDLIMDCCETTSFKDSLKEVLSSPAQWDSQHKFCFENVRLFVPLADSDLNPQTAGHVLEVDFNQNLKDLLSQSNIVITNFLPVLQIYTREHLLNKLENVSNQTFVFRFK